MLKILIFLLLLLLWKACRFVYLTQKHKKKPKAACINSFFLFIFQILPRLLQRLLPREAYENSRTWRQIFYGGDRDDNTPSERGPTETDVFLRDSP